ncbi:hypothetical protein MMU07_03420 [Aquiflexum sp. LQ15W]|uniref:hypothetical protein n=1 Tax=Cognataquiflexum nitidum TaxID=2922272 RepID=UPI001F1363F1|nr:hypothetical protein [Cognataquiflexum nitidum]MCH6198615.1 hypothetical protein [Cognataquiflexum nitidum]
MEIQFDLTTEDPEIELMQSFPGTYDWDCEEGPFFEEVLEEVLVSRVQAKLQEMTPLLQGVSIQSLSVGADLYGMQGVLAQCISEKNEDGSYSVGVIYGPDVIQELLSAHWDSSYSINPYYDMTIVHELLHLADQSELSLKNIGHNIPDPVIQFFGWMRMWRSEGLADLPAFKRGLRGLQDPLTVKQRISEAFKTLSEVDWKSCSGMGDYEAVYEPLSFIPYEVGPYLLHQVILATSVPASSEADNHLSGMIPMLQSGLGIGFEAFWHHIMKDGQGLVDAGLLQDILTRLFEASGLQAYQSSPEDEAMAGPILEIYKKLAGSIYSEK